MSVDRVLTLAPDGIVRAEIRAGARLTEELWRDAHGLHSLRDRMHFVTMHGPGIVSGLQVTATDPGSRFVTIHPGVAVDARGNVLTVTENDRDRALRLLNVDIGRPGWIHIIMEFRDDSSEPAADSTNNYLRTREYVHCEATSTPPGPNQLELARILLTPDGKPVLNAADPLRPRANELDFRFRSIAANSARTDLVIGQIFHARAREQTYWDLNRVGLTLLAQHIQLTTQYGARIQPLVRLNGDENECSVLYLTGGQKLALNAEQTEALRTYINNGGVVIAESSQNGFDAAARGLCDELGIRLEPVNQDHPALRCCHVFGIPPEGGPADQGGLFFGYATAGAGAFLLSLRDYGGAWEGPQGLERSRVRDAMEFGTNLAVWADLHRATARLERLAPPQTGNI